MSRTPMSTTSDYPQLLEISRGAMAVTFTANGEYLVGSGPGVRVWRVKDGELVATMAEKLTFCVTASNDGRWFAGALWDFDAAGNPVASELLVWDARTYEQVFGVKFESSIIFNLDFSPDASYLVGSSGSAKGASSGTATIWDVAARGTVQTLEHDGLVFAARYSPQGDRVATTTEKSVCVWDSNNGRLLVNIDVRVGSMHNLIWRNHHLFVITEDSTIKEIDTATGLTVSSWSVPDVDERSCLALPQHGKFIAYATKKVITFWDTATRAQFSHIPYTRDIPSIAFSPDGRLLAIAESERIVIRDLASVFPSASEPELDIDSTTLDAWKRGQLTNAEASLSAAIQTSKNTHHALASRALIRTRLGQWDAALVDAEKVVLTFDPYVQTLILRVTKSIKIQRSVIGYIAKCVALVSKGETDRGCGVCDIASLYFPSHHVFLLLIKIVVLFMNGKHLDAISRLDDLITNGWVDPALRVVQAYMHILLGDEYMKSSTFDHAIQSFENARIGLSGHTRQPPLIVLLISGWHFDDLSVTIQQRLCEALFAAGRMEEAGGSILRMVDQEINMTEPTKTWVSDFKRRFCDKLMDLGDCATNAGQYDKAISRYTAVLSLGPSDPQDLLMKRSNARMGKGVREDALSDAKEWTRLVLMSGSWKDVLTTGVGFIIERSSIYRTLCEHLETTGSITDAVACFHQMSSELAEEKDGEQANWASDFESRCRGKLENLGDSAMNAKEYDEAISQYTAALSLGPATPRDLLVKRSNTWMSKGAQQGALSDAQEWTRLMLTSGSWEDALIAGVGFVLEKFSIYCALCEHLETTGRVADALACFHQMSSELAHEIDGEKANWAHSFKSRCRSKIEALGDSATIARQYDEAISQYTVTLSLDPPNPQYLYVKRSKSYAGKGLWKDALNDADEVIKLDPSSSLGYERKHQALRGAGNYVGATDAFETMLVKMSESPDLVIRERSRKYVRPEATQKVIRTAIQNAIRHSPPVLINTNSGRLCNRSQQIAAFGSMPIFTELICSMTTHIDHALIEEEVAKFYRYATLSHTWEGDEPLYEKVIKIVVHDLEASPTHNKLQMFCKIVRDEGFYWAWSDTCCINKGNHFVLQEALVRMFKWYEGSAVTIIFLFDVDELAELGALMRSKWNSRGWTLQEYHASKVVRIYTKDWTPYLGLTIHNHKESPEIISEMEKATGISAESLKALRPGLNNIREKLRLASMRQTTQVEDAAYSLLGIFSMSLPVTYGEEDKALGRLLSQLLMSSGDTSILAWSGKSGSFNSCLPACIVVFSQPVTSHIPPAIPDVEMKAITAGLHALSLDLDLVTRLYDRVDGLHAPTFAGQRMRLPCLAFQLRLVSRRWDGSKFVFRAQAGVLGKVEIETKQVLTPQDSLYLVHPWIDFLLGRRASEKTVEIMPHETSELDEFVLFDLLTDHPSASLADPLDTGSPSSPTLLQMDVQVPAYEFLARLRQPFGALLLVSDPLNTAKYSRVSTESLITVQVGEITPAMLNRLMQSVKVLDVL